MLLSIAVVGRPNVGKSTLFNRLTHSHHAIVDNTPGVTRDRREGKGKISDLEFSIFDTAGLENHTNDDLKLSMQKQTEIAFDNATIALLLIDGRVGVTPMDRFLAKTLRTRKTPIILVVNKCEGNAGEGGISEAYSLGFGTPIPISAEHGGGLEALYIILKKESLKIKHRTEMTTNQTAYQHPEKSALKLAIVGRPNVGKSTMINKIIGQNRLLVGPESGVTRDSISVFWEFEGRLVRLVDTAGMRKKARIKEKLEYLSVGDTLRSIRFAEVVVLVLNANEVFDKQDLTIARHIIEEGRALIIAINKWDIVEDKKKVIQRIEAKLETSLPQIRGIKVITCSAKTGNGLNQIMPSILKTYTSWNQRIATGILNRWLFTTTEAHPPPLLSGRRIRLRYITQSGSRPPTFVLFSSKGDKLPESYCRYLINRLRTDLELPGVPIRLHIRKGTNPYVEGEK